MNIDIQQLSDKTGLDKTNIKIGKWRILAVIVFGLGYFIFYSRGQDWLLYWLAWLFYAALWLPFQGRHTGESPNAWTYFFMVGDVLFFLLAAGIESDLLSNYSVMLILPLFQYLLRYGRKAALYYACAATAAVGYIICLFHYEAHPAKHYVVTTVMFLIAWNEGLLVQKNRELRNSFLIWPFLTH